MTAATARRLRRNQTDAESKLWLRLRGRRLEGLKFRRQVPVAGYVVDFLCEEARFIVEIDGGHHTERLAEDEARTAALQRHGYQVIRFWNNEVLSNMDGVLERIVEMIRLAKGDYIPSP